MSVPLVSRDFSSSRCSLAHFGVFSFSRERGVRSSLVASWAMGSRSPGETWTIELEKGFFSGGSGWDSSSSEPGRRDIMMGSGRDVDGCEEG